MVQFVVKASILSSILNRNELLTLAYYVDEMVRFEKVRFCLMELFTCISVQIE